MNLPKSPAGWAIRITEILQAVEKTTGQCLYPVRIQDIATDLSRNLFPDAPLTRITGENLGDRFEGMLARVPGTANEWGIIYNTAIKSPGRINFTLAHEFGHYLLHRAELGNGQINCSRQNMLDWDSEYGRREAEANEFASYLLMPRNTFEQQIGKQKISLHLMQQVADRFNVSLTAALLKWLQLTSQRAMLVIGDNGFVKWARSSERLYKSGVYLKPKKEPLELPPQSLAVSRDASVDAKTGVLHKAGTWPYFSEDVHEMTVHADTYEGTISLLLFPDDPPPRWREPDEEPELMDTFEKFTRE